MSNFPVTDGRRLGLHMSSTGHTVSLGLAGAPSGPVVFDVPAFVNNIAGTSTGQLNEAAGTVTIAAGTKNVSVRLRHLQLTPAATSLRIDPASAVHAGAGGSATVTATFADSGPGADRDLRLAVQAPAGWHVTPVGSSTAASVAAGTTFTGRWRVTSPQDHTNTAMLTAVASYTDATTGRQERSTARELGPPGISRLSVKRAAAGQTVTVDGSGFGRSQGTSSALQFTDQGTTWSAPGTLPTLRVLQWTDHAIVFQVPTPSGPGGDTYHV